MVAPALRPGHALLRCPICRLDLAPSAGALACRRCHSFDVAREGYVNLLSGGHRQPAVTGDSASQIRHRIAFLAAGHFDMVAEAIVAHLRESEPGNAASSNFCVLDAGAGTGDHLAKVTGGLGNAPVGLGLDISKDAARLAGRRWPGLALAVADLWREWPVQDDAVDLVISLFAPKNFAETARVLRPGGWLAIAYPGPMHLAEFNRSFGLMGHGAHKDQRYADAARRAVGPCTVRRLVRRTLLDGAAVRDVILMGPNAHRVSAAAFEPQMAARPVTFDIALLFSRKRCSN